MLKQAPSDRTDDSAPPAPTPAPTKQNRLIAASRGLFARLGLTGRSSQPRESCTPLPPNALKKILTGMICQEALTPEAYEFDKDNWQPMSFSQWQAMYLKSYCNFVNNGNRLSLTLFMRHWEVLVRQSVMFDPDNFMNSLNTIVNEYGWFVESFTMPDQSVTVIFHRYNGDVMLRQQPHSLYYFAPAWNKDDLIKNGLLPNASVDAPAGRRVAEYDVLFKSYNLVYIRSIAKAMYESSVSYSDSDDVSTNILRLLGHLPIIVFKLNPLKIADHVWSRKAPIYDEDKESGILISYTYLPPDAFEAVMHDDPIPDLLNRAWGRDGGPLE